VRLQVRYFDTRIGSYSLEGANLICNQAL
jgi:hypothetical protein